MVTRGLIVSEVLGLTPYPMGANILGFNDALLLVVGDVPVDDVEPALTWPILRNCQLSIRRCS
jgi:hypothetical protein